MMKYFTITVILVFTMVWISCRNCDDAANHYKKDSFNIVIKSKPGGGTAYTLRGFNPSTGLNEKYYDDGGFLGMPFRALIEQGDTLVKNQGELKVYIHKNDTVIIFPYKCKGRVYE